MPPTTLATVLYKQFEARRRLALERRYNPDWHLQPRIPRGHGQYVSGTWTDGDGVLLASVGPLGPILSEITRELIRFAVRRALPYLRNLPRRWRGRPLEDEDFDVTGRIAEPTPRRPEHPAVRFRSDSELKRYLEPAGEDRHWHHIVEQRLADPDVGRFPPEMIHNTDNVINLPKIVHECVNAEMSKLYKNTKGLTVRMWLEPKSFEEQFDFGLKLIEDCIERLGP